MRTTVILVFTCLLQICITGSLFAQDILDATESHLIIDYIAFDSSTYSVQTVGTCRYGLLIRENENGSDTIRYGYLIDAQFDTNEDSWVAVVNSIITDDAGEFELNLVFPNVNGEMENFSLSNNYGLFFKSFTMYNNDILLINKESNDLELISDRGWSRETIATTKTYNFIDQVNGKLFGIHDTGIDMLDSSFQILTEISFPYHIQSQKSIDNKIFLIGKNTLDILDADLNPILYETINTRDSIADVTLSNDTLFILENDDNNYSYLSYLDTDASIKLIEKEERAHYSFQSFVDGSAKGTIYGEQRFATKEVGPHPRANDIIYRNTIVSDRSALNKSKADCSLAMLDISTSKEERVVGIGIDGDTITKYDYIHAVSLELTNLSRDLLDNCLITSSSYGGFNCFLQRYEQRFKNLSLNSGESIRLDFVFTTFQILEEICFDVLTINGEVDIDFSNNGTCAMISSAQETEALARTLIYPNPSEEILYIETDRRIQQAIIYDVNGKRIIAGTINDGQLTTSACLPGVYILELIDRSNRNSRHKIVIK